jgi:dihydrofolate reductase
VVVTTRPLADAPPEVEAGSGDMVAIAAELEGRGCHHIWVFGGGQIVRAMIAIGKLGVLERP